MPTAPSPGPSPSRHRPGSSSHSTGSPSRRRCRRSGRPWRGHHRCGVDGQRLHPRLRRAPARRCRPRRPVRAPADVHRRHRHLHAGSTAAALAPDRRRTRGRPDGPGRRRGDLRAPVDDPAHRGDAPETPRRRARRLGRDRRSRGGAGSPARRRADALPRCARSALRATRCANDSLASSLTALAGWRSVFWLVVPLGLARWCSPGRPRREPGAADRALRRCACSAAGPSLSPTPSRCCTTPRSSARCSWSPTCCRPDSGPARSTPVCACCPMAVMPMLLAPVGGAAADRWGTRMPMAAGVALVAAGAAGLAAVVRPGVAYATLAPPLVLMGAGSGLFFAPFTAAVLGAARRASKAGRRRRRRRCASWAPCSASRCARRSSPPTATSTRPRRAVAGAARRCGSPPWSPERPCWSRSPCPPDPVPLDRRSPPCGADASWPDRSPPSLRPAGPADHAAVRELLELAYAPTPPSSIPPRGAPTAPTCSTSIGTPGTAAARRRGRRRDRRLRDLLPRRRRPRPGLARQVGERPRAGGASLPPRPRRRRSAVPGAGAAHPRIRCRGLRLPHLPVHGHRPGLVPSGWATSGCPASTGR